MVFFGGARKRAQISMQRLAVMSNIIPLMRDYVNVVSAEVEPLQVDS